MLRVKRWTAEDSQPTPELVQNRKQVGSSRKWLLIRSFEKARNDKRVKTDVSVNHLMSGLELGRTEAQVLHLRSKEDEGVDQERLTARWHEPLATGGFRLPRGNCTSCC